MNHLIYGDSNYLITKEKKQLISKLNTHNDYEIVTCDLTNLNETLLSIKALSLFASQKILIVDNFYAITTQSKKDDEEIVEQLIKVMSENKYEIILIVPTSLDERKKITKTIKSMANLYPCLNVSIGNLNKYLLEYVNANSYKITSIALNNFINKVGFNLDLLISELDKLFVYKCEDKNIDENDINEITIKLVKTDSFSLLKSIMTKNYKNSFNMLDELLINGTDVFLLIGLIASQIRLLYQIKLLTGQMNSLEMATHLQVDPYRVKKSLELVNSFKLQELKELLLLLAQLDINIKTGKIDKKLGLELFILNV